MGGYARIKASIYDETGRLIAQGTKTEFSERFMDFVEKAETGAIKDFIASGESVEREIDQRLTAVLAAIPNIPLEDVPEGKDETGNIEVRLGDYMLRPHQKWTITPVAGAGGYPGSPYFKITLAGTDRALAATAEAELVTVPAFTGAPEQLWRIDQLTDGTYRIQPKVVPNSSDALALTAVGGSTPTLAKFDPQSDKARWTFELP